MKVTLYTIHCRDCEVLFKKLMEKNIEVTVVDDMEVMKKMHFLSAPMLQIDDQKPMTFVEAVKWVNQQERV